MAVPCIGVYSFRADHLERRIYFEVVRLSSSLLIVIVDDKTTELDRLAVSIPANFLSTQCEVTVSDNQNIARGGVSSQLLGGREDDDGYSELLTRRLAERTGKHIAVFNCVCGIDDSALQRTIEKAIVNEIVTEPSMFELPTDVN